MKDSFLMKTMSIYLDEPLKEFLERLYIGKERTLTEISIAIAQRTKVGIDITTIGRWMRKYNIPVRSRNYRRKNDKDNYHS